MRIFSRWRMILACLLTGLSPLAAWAETINSTEKPSYEIETISIEDRSLTLKVPSQAAPGKPWLWVGEFGGHLKKLEAALLEQGWHVAYLPFSNRFGSPEEIAIWEKAYDYLTSERGLAPRPALLGISRGGLYVNAWTRKHPDRVSVLYLDNGVCDPRSWPGGFQLSTKGRGSKKDWEHYKATFDFASDEEALKQAVDPVAGFESVISNDVLLISVHGTADGTVPYEDNAKRLVELWQKTGGRVEVFAKEGGRHHPHGPPDNAPLVRLLNEEDQGAR